MGIKSAKPRAKERIGVCARAALAKPSGGSRADAVLERFRVRLQQRTREGRA
ncbi:hypothetical protein GobsT_71570 [Gemmata obscuriglobus]|uniref:hypothetical protein n=1 Tax=Gemmata obscuriglobus TaxID=114 RepID=UPI00016C593D|nr:hypothetical protein [Gemmata obscuriglobus]QEG32304.1 hypothetical protein GobsT_71570 [Gemmata obscuriglobus]VTS11660.1 unnamed protein product [Gemmata obscuriglobus UQM 2246]